MVEDKKLKAFLVLQSFCPLFVLIFIQHVGHFELVGRFFCCLFRREWSVFARAFANPVIGEVIISSICVVWFFITLFVFFGFRNYQKYSYDVCRYRIRIIEERNDSGVTFLVSFLLPLLINDVSSLRGIVFFLVLLVMVIVLLMRSNLFYQNPVLVVLGYKTFVYQLDDSGEKQGKTYIGISKGSIPDGCKIKYKYIADGVSFIAIDSV